MALAVRDHNHNVLTVCMHTRQFRAQVRDWDFFSDAPFPLGHDVITMGMVLHDWGLARKKLLMRKVRGGWGGCPWPRG